MPGSEAETSVAGEQTIRAPLEMNDVAEGIPLAGAEILSVRGEGRVGTDWILVVREEILVVKAESSLVRWEILPLCEEICRSRKGFLSLRDAFAISQMAKEVSFLDKWWSGLRE